MDAKFWKQALKEAEQELDAATRLSDVNAAAKRLMLAKRELKRLQEAPAAYRRGARGAAGAAPFAFSADSRLHLPA